MIYYVGDTATFTVPALVDTDFVDVYLTRNGTDWTKLNVSAIATIHEKVGDQEVYQPLVYEWIVVGDESETCRVKIQDSEDESVFAQSAVFEIQERVLTSIVLSPPSVRMVFGAQRTFTANCLDQTGTALDTQPEVTFTTNSVYGTVNAQGVFTAGETEGVCTVTATVGEISGTATVTVLEKLPNKTGYKYAYKY